MIGANRLGQSQERSWSTLLQRAIIQLQLMKNLLIYALGVSNDPSKMTQSSHFLVSISDLECFNTIKSHFGNACTSPMLIIFINKFNYITDIFYIHIIKINSCNYMFTSPLNYLWDILETLSFFFFFLYHNGVIWLVIYQYNIT